LRACTAGSSNNIAAAYWDPLSRQQRILLPLWDCPAGKQQVFSKAAMLEAEQAVFCHVPFAKFADALTTRYLLDKVCSEAQAPLSPALIWQCVASAVACSAYCCTSCCIISTTLCFALPEWTGCCTLWDKRTAFPLLGTAPHDCPQVDKIADMRQEDAASAAALQLQPRPWQSAGVVTVTGAWVRDDWLECWESQRRQLQEWLMRQIHGRVLRLDWSPGQTCFRSPSYLNSAVPLPMGQLKDDYMVFVDLVRCVCTRHSSILTCVTAEHDLQLGCAIKLNYNYSAR